MPETPIITITTDFGWQDSYVAEMKGPILGSHREGQLVDVTHDVPPQDVARGSFLLERLAVSFPRGTVHLAVIDPGVGSKRRILVADIEGQLYVLPDNGLLTGVLERHTVARLIEVSNSNFFRRPVSNTFHGRDIMAPVAAYLSKGVCPHELGWPLADSPVMLTLPSVEETADGIAGCVVTSDRFGNLVTNIRAPQLPVANRANFVVHVGGLEVIGVNAYYSQRSVGSLIALIGSHGRLEIGIAGGDARATHQIREGTPVRVDFPSTPSSPQ